MAEIPEWLEGKQFSNEALAELRKVKKPVAFLGELSDDRVPDHLYPLVMAARMINGFAVYGDPAPDKARALRRIKQVREELRDAEHRCQE